MNGNPNITIDVATPDASARVTLYGPPPDLSFFNRPRIFPAGITVNGVTVTVRSDGVVVGDKGAFAAALAGATGHNVMDHITAALLLNAPWRSP